jgi:cell division GTPase FtsZ
MASKVGGYYVWRPKKTGSKEKSSEEPEDNIKMSEEEKNKEESKDHASDNVATLSPSVHANQFEDADEFEFDFVDAYSDDVQEDQSELLPENVTQSAISCAFLGIGGGGGKLAKAFIDLGFTRSLLVNTTIKDQPDGVSEQNFLLIPGADGVGKDVVLGKKILTENSALVEDAVRARLGSPDWLFVLAGGGGGTGSSCHVLHDSLTRYLKTVGASGKVVYIASKPSSQELLNSTIKNNYEELLSDIANYPHIIIDNERQLQLLRNKVGMLNLYPMANKNFAKLLSQSFKLAATHSDVQTFDSKDLEKCLSTPGRMLIGSTVIRETTRRDLGAAVLSGCISASPCPPPPSHTKTGALLLVASSEMASDPKISKNLEAAFSYVGGRTDTLFSGVYIKEKIPGLIAICLLSG